MIGNSLKVCMLSQVFYRCELQVSLLHAQQGGALRIVGVDCTCTMRVKGRGHFTQGTGTQGIL